MVILKALRWSRQRDLNPRPADYEAVVPVGAAFSEAVGVLRHGAASGGVGHSTPAGKGSRPPLHRPPEQPVPRVLHHWIGLAVGQEPRLAARVVEPRLLADGDGGHAGADEAVDGGGADVEVEVFAELGDEVALGEGLVGGHGVVSPSGAGPRMAAFEVPSRSSIVQVRQTGLHIPVKLPCPVLWTILAASSNASRLTRASWAS